jgi:membrane-associated protease RseP (regulator of RpoE activity)
MKQKARDLAAMAALVGGIVLAGPLQAQQGEEEGRIRVLTMSQGSYLGVFIDDVGAEDVERLGLREERGVLIEGVAEEGPARDAGLQEDDVVLAWNGSRIESQAQLRRMLKETPPGRTAEVNVFRDGSERSFRVELGEHGPRAFSFRSEWDDAKAHQLREGLETAREKLRGMDVRVRGMPHITNLMTVRGARLGVGIQSLQPQLADYFGLGDRSGVLITTVQEDSPAEKAGLKAGDVILALDGEAIERPGDVSRKVWDAEPGPVAIRVLRDRSERTVTVELPEKTGLWHSEEGEVHGFMFGPEGLELDDLNVEWAEPIRIRIEETGPFMWRHDGPSSFDIHVPDSEDHVEPVHFTSPSPRVLSI